MPEDDKKRAAHRALVDRILRGPGQADYQDAPKVAAVLADLEPAPVEEPLPAALRMLGKLTSAGEVSAADMRGVLAAGVSPRQVEDSGGGAAATVAMWH